MSSPCHLVFFGYFAEEEPETIHHVELIKKTVLEVADYVGGVSEHGDFLGEGVVGGVFEADGGCLVIRE